MVGLLIRRFMLRLPYPPRLADWPIGGRGRNVGDAQVVGHASTENQRHRWLPTRRFMLNIP